MYVTHAMQGCVIFCTGLRIGCLFMFLNLSYVPDPKRLLLVVNGGMKGGGGKVAIRMHCLHAYIIQG